MRRVEYGTPIEPLLRTSIVFDAGDTLTTEKQTGSLTLPERSRSGDYILYVTKPQEDTAGDMTVIFYDQVKNDGSTLKSSDGIVMTVPKISGAETNIHFKFTGIMAPEGTINIGAYFSADSGAITPLFTLYAA